MSKADDHRLPNPYPMSQNNFRPSFSWGQSFPSYNGNSYSNFNMSQQQPLYASHRASDPGQFVRPRHSQDDGIDLSQFDDMARSTVNDVQVQDVIKPEQAGPWVGAHPTVNQHRQLPSPQFNSSYARTEPPPKQDIYSETADSGYQSQFQTAGPPDFWSKQELERDHQFLVPPPRDVDVENKSTVSDGRLIRGTRDGRRKTPLAPCLLCGRAPKNQSDAKKHDLTHTKPYICTEQDCSRKDGFATDNDLQRHRKSVHNLQPTVGNPVGYICVACNIPEGSPAKFWPRRDNFKAHIKRKHPTHNEEQLIERSKQTMRPDDSRTADDDARTVRSAMQSAAHHSEGDPDELRPFHQIHNSPSLSRHASDQGSYPNNLWPPSANSPMFNDEMLSGMHGHTADMHHYSAGSMGPTGANGLNILSDNFDMQESSSYAQPPPNKKQKTSRMDDYAFSPTDHEHQFSLPEPQTTSTSSSSGTQSSAMSPPGDFQCPECPKTKKRECDLKKHMKRHTRPYGCTFPNCQKKFGSRNDWKRHETTQHFLQEQWKCQRPRLDNPHTTCSRRPFHQLDLLKAHLAGPDHLTPPSEIEAACRAFRLGRDGHDHFWCGFCVRLVEQGRELQNAFDERFKHIGDHFDKGGCDSGDWVCIDENKKKRFITQEDRREAKRRARNGFREDDEGLPDYLASQAFGGGEEIFASSSHKHPQYESNADGMFGA